MWIEYSLVQVPPPLILYSIVGRHAAERVRESLLAVTLHRIDDPFAVGLLQVERQVIDLAAGDVDTDGQRIAGRNRQFARRRDPQPGDRWNVGGRPQDASQRRRRTFAKHDGQQHGQQEHCHQPCQTSQKRDRIDDLPNVKLGQLAAGLPQQTGDHLGIRLLLARRVGPMEIQHGEQTIVHAADGPFDAQGHVFQRQAAQRRPDEQAGNAADQHQPEPDGKQQAKRRGQGNQQIDGDRCTQPADRQQGDQRAADQQRHGDAIVGWPDR